MGIKKQKNANKNTNISSGTEKAIQAGIGDFVNDQGTILQIFKDTSTFKTCRVSSSQKNKATVCLNMIVKDEAHIIKETLDSISPFIDYWVICDTGSTDGTQELIKKYFADKKIPGELYYHTWENFEHNRTLALKMARGRCDYSIVIDADDLFHGTLTISSTNFDGYLLEIVSGNTCYRRTQVFKNSVAWEYKGVLHEFPQRANKSKSPLGHLYGCYIESRRLGNRSKDDKKYEKDAQILTNAINTGRDTNLKARYTFYAAQSYRDSRQYELAIKYYKKRAKLGKFIEEIYYSQFQVGKLLDQIGGDQEEIISWYKDGYQTIPRRSETLFGLAQLYLKNGDYQESYKYAKLAADNIYPKEYVLFLEKDIYEWKAMFVASNVCLKLEKYHEAFRYCQIALAQRTMPDGVRKNFEQCRDQCVDHIKNNSYNAKKIIETVKRLKTQNNKKRIVMTMTSCKRYSLFEKTVKSFINCCLDLDLIDHFICVDDNSSEEDRAKMAKLFPFFEYIWKTPEQRGHAKSMNILRKMTRDYEYIVHMEDDFFYFEPLGYIQTALDLLNNKPEIGQVLFNRNYCETLEDRHIIGGDPIVVDSYRYLVHDFYPRERYQDFLKKFGPGPSSFYWPHYSLRPSVIRAKIWQELGEFSENPDCHFEMDYAYRYINRQYKSAFFDTISCIHIGRLTKERQDKTKLNAYDLNSQAQFGTKRIITAPKFEGYTFHKGLDSPGNDFVIASGLPLEKLKELCNSNPKLVGFNTWGFLKTKIRPKDQMVKIADQNNSYVDGIYEKVG